MSKATKMAEVKQLVQGVENAFNQDRRTTFKLLDRLKEMCQPFQYVDEKVDRIETLLLDYKTDTDQLYSATGAVISALQMYDENHPSWRGWV